MKGPTSAYLLSPSQTACQGISTEPTMATDTPIFDIVMMGGGTAGLVLARRLSKDNSIQVVVLEAAEDKSADMRVSTQLCGRGD